MSTRIKLLISILVVKEHQGTLQHQDTLQQDTLQRQDTLQQDTLQHGVKRVLCCQYQLVGVNLVSVLTPKVSEQCQNHLSCQKVTNYGIWNVESKSVESGCRIHIPTKQIKENKEK